MDAAQSLLQRAAPADLEKNLKGLTETLKDNSDAVEALLTKHQIPFGIITTTDKGDRTYLTCQYNRVGDGQYRSPWTDKIPHPSQNYDFRMMELMYNEVWDAYKNLYYGNEAVGSVFLKQSSDCALKGLFGVCKKREGAGSWHSASFVTVQEPGPEMCQYRVETFVVVVLDPSDDKDLQVDLSASLSKDVTKECKITPNMMTASHIENLGEIIESNEMDLRSQLERVQVPKVVELIDSLMKEKTKFKPPVNPLMGMIMDSSVLKKKLAN